MVTGSPRAREPRGFALPWATLALMPLWGCFHGSRDPFQDELIRSGHQIACVREHIYIRDFASGLRVLASGLGNPTFQLLEDGRIAMSDSSLELVIRRLDGPVEDAFPGASAAALVFDSAEGRLALWGAWPPSDQFGLYVVDWPTRQVVFFHKFSRDRPTPGDRPAAVRRRSVSWIGTTGTLVVSDGERLSRLSPTAKVSVDLGPGSDATVDPSGKWIALVNPADDTLAVGDLLAEGIRIRWKDKRHILTQPRWSSDSKFIAYNAEARFTPATGTVIRSVPAWQEFWLDAILVIATRIPFNRVDPQYDWIR